LRLLQLIEVNRLSSCSRGLFNVKATTEAGKAFGAYPPLRDDLHATSPDREWEAIAEPTFL